jgi:uncharacterized protein YciI
MLYVAVCTDKPDHTPLRLETRPAHLDYLGSLGEKLRAAGALMSDDLKSVVGSMLILAVETEAEARQMVAGDPFSKVGLFASVEVKPWRQAPLGISLA